MKLKPQDQTEHAMQEADLICVRLTSVPKVWASESFYFFHSSKEQTLFTLSIH